ncbi:MAG TPA: OmpH family outer membrane protein [Firmicutes bacterium]|jgi:outer membrane protein|nr:OmpH family outer membrane protein [Bacillota bacterium]
MKRSLAMMVIGLMVVLLMASFSVGASGATNVSVAVVNIDKIINESLAGQGANRELLQLIKEKQDELNKIADAINALQKELETKDTAEKQQELTQLVNEYQQKVDEANSQIQSEAQRMRNELVGEIQEIILAIGEEQNYSLIIDSATITYYTRTNIIDITGEVVRRYNQTRNSW